MAVSMSDTRKSLEEFERHISCAICHDKFSNPIILPCGHSFCKQCIIRRLNLVDDGGPFMCPECHNVSSKDWSSKLCEAHNDVKILYCFDCMELICRDCTIQNHKNHNYKYNSNVAPEIKEKLLKSLDPLVNTQNDFLRAVMDVKSLENLTEAQASMFTEYVTEVFDKLHTIVENRKKEILETNKIKVSKILQNLKELEEELTEVAASIHKTVEDTKYWSLVSSSDEFMNMYASLEHQIETEKEKFRYDPSSRRYGTYKMKPEKQKINDVNFKDISEFQEFVEDFIRLVDIPVLENHVLNEPCLIVQTNTENELSMLSRSPVDKWQFELVSLQDCLNEFEISRIGSSSYRITYVAPSVPGVYKLNISMDGGKVKSNPIEVNVRKQSFWKLRRK